ncbi:MAG: adenylosuccinate synthase [Candidatus Marinimicrobia bacterium]|nr:adenylosuccinate synthase [Candidatus Neomarinimicrobiota bacterium]MCF7829881.1 adenylosuccinate synthase [Candidatus Neomarinimicrobiota bacterium]MCF7879156.1 adenylosuccinate synthase [Candidatus Neomarinimicrobiota bacterium]
MGIHVIVGGQWGDEGKGKIVDHFSKDADIVARYQGGANAGHTVYIGEEKFILHQIPSGILRPSTRCLLGTGMVIDPIELTREIRELQDRGLNCSNQIGVAYNAHLVLPVHRALDGISEDADDVQFIGTTRRGIGPTYSDRHARIGIPAHLMLDADEFRTAVLEHLEFANKSITGIYGKDAMNSDEFMGQLMQARDVVKPLITDVSAELLDALAADKYIIGEGAQGVMLDLDYGSYPYVTSSHPGTAGVSVGLGVPPAAVTRSTGIFKAYCTRVGEGPFPTELTAEEAADKLREAGGEYGATTGRPRRCGWFDGVLGKYSADINGFTDICITKADVLESFAEIPVAESYEQESSYLNVQKLEDAIPHYSTYAGWNSDISAANSFAEFPESLRHYLQSIENLMGTPISMVSTGPERSQLVQNESFSPA